MKIITDLFFIFLFRQSLNSGITLHIQSNLIWTSHISIASHVSAFGSVALRTEAAGTPPFLHSPCACLVAGLFGVSSLASASERRGLLCMSLSRLS